MSPVLVCAEYPDEHYARWYDGVATAVRRQRSRTGSRPASDGPGSFSVEATSVAAGGERRDLPPDSVTRLGEASCELPRAGRATLKLRLSRDGVDEANAYEFAVTRLRVRPGP